MEPILILASAGLLTSLVGVLSTLIKRFTKSVWGRARPAVEPYSDRVARLTLSLEASAKEAEAVAREMTETIEKRAAALADAEAQLSEMEAREKDLAERLANLEQIRPDSMKVFEEAMDRRMAQNEKSARMFFLWGIIATVIVGALGLWLAPVLTQ